MTDLPVFKAAFWLGVLAVAAIAFIINMIAQRRAERRHNGRR